jgi:hypothetical protein
VVCLFCWALPPQGHGLYHIGSNFWKFYLIRMGFFAESVETVHYWCNAKKIAKRHTPGLCNVGKPLICRCVPTWLQDSKHPQLRSVWACRFVPCMVLLDPHSFMFWCRFVQNKKLLCFATLFWIWTNHHREVRSSY